MLESWVSFVLRFRWLLALIWAGLVLASISAAPRLEFRFNLGEMLRGSDQQVAKIREFYKTFPPADGHVMLTATSDEILTVNHLRAAAKWANQVKELPEVKDVLSPDLLLNLKLDGFTLDQWAQLGGTGDEPVALGDGAGMETFKGNLISRDLKSVALYVIKDRGVRGRNLHRAVESVQAPPWEGANVRIVGTPYLLEQMGTLLRSNFATLLLFELFALLLVIPFFMRSFRRAYLPVMLAVSALLVYTGLFVLAGQEFGVMHLAGPGLILIIGLADAIHLQQKFDDARASGNDVRGSLIVMFRSVGRACALTSLTTACGFLSLLVARHEEVYDFGIWCAVGVVTAYVTVIIFLPVALVFFPGTGKVPRFRSVINTGMLRRYAVPVTVVLIVLAAGIYRIKIDSSLDRELPEGADVVKNVHWFAENFRGLNRIEFDLRADLRDPKVFSVVERMQNEIRELPGISGSRSYVDAVRMTLAPEVVETEDGPMLGVQALASGGALPRNLLNRELDRACIVFYRMPTFGTGSYEDLRDRVGRYEMELPEGASLKVNGALPMFYESTTLISKTMLISLLCSLLMITFILAFVLRSAKLALLCLVPNAVPLLVVAGVSGWIDSPLHLGILIVFSVGLGLAVDDTIHLMVRFKQLQKENPDGELRALLDEAIVTTGFAIILTSVVLVIAALCFLGSSFTTMRWTGVTLGIVAISALLADLMVLPWLIEKFDRRPIRKLEPSTSPG